MKHPLFTVTLTLIIGMIAGRFIFFPVAALLAGVLLLLAGQSYLYWRARSNQVRPPSGRLLFVALLLLGMLQQYRVNAIANQAEIILAQLAGGGEVKIAGRLAGDPQLSADYSQLTLDHVEVLAGKQFLRFPAKVLVTCKDPIAGELAANPPAWGDRLIVWGRLERPHGPLNPDQFDYEQYLESRGIHGVVWLTDALSLQRERATGAAALLGGLHRSLIRFRLRSQQLLEAHFTPKQRQVLWAICFGGGSRIDPELQRAFMLCGLMHIFSVSGLHASIIGLLIFTLCRLLQASRRAAAIVTIGGLLVYMTLAAFSPPVIRAVIMTSALMYSYFISTKIDSISTLSLALFFNVLFFPASLDHPGFQLSYLAMFGIVVFYPTASSFLLLVESEQEKKAPFRFKRWINIGVMQVLGGSLSAQVLFVPLLAQSFYHVPLLGQLLNVVILPLVLILLALSSALFICGMIAPLLVGPLAIPTAIICDLMNSLIAFAGPLPLVSLQQQPWPWWAAAAYYALWLIPPTILEFRTPLDLPKQKAAFLQQLCAMAVLLAAMPVLTRPAVKDFRAAFLDVGQGDCTLLQIPGGQTILIDAGKENSGWRNILPYLESQGIRRIDLAVITHDDADHYGGFIALCGRMPITQMLLPADPTLSAELRELLTRLTLARTDIRHVASPARIEGFRGTAITLVSPGQFQLDTPEINDNDLSIVLRIAYGQFELLETGDISGAAENQLAALSALDRLDVLKVSHHGSKFSSTAEFLSRVRPAISIISCGRANRYGHPAPEALERLQQAGTAVYRTDRDGAIILETDGTLLHIRTLIEQRQ